MIRMSRAVFALVAACALVTACGGGDSSVTTGAPGATTTPPTTAEADAPRAQDGDLVRVHYTGMLEDGEVFDSSVGGEPLEFVIGGGGVISGFDVAVRGLAVGETRTQRIEPADGYGELNPELIIEVPIDQLPEGVVVGDELTSGTGQTVVVLALDEATGLAELDANHFLAGKVLIFDVELVEIVPS